MIRRNKSTTDEALANGEAFDRAMRRAYEDALCVHRESNTPLVFARDGRVVWVDPHTLEEVPEPEFAKKRPE